MPLRKDDPIYYKKKITDLINQAKENGLLVYLSEDYSNKKYLSFKCAMNYDTASVLLEDLINTNEIKININDLCEPNPVQEMVNKANENYMNNLLKKYSKNK